uniref:Uncharacterized protein n=1 Tax=Meloidogyne hapla TaxID=6305 RepID=A0A1I8BU77_MELHA
MFESLSSIEVAPEKNIYFYKIPIENVSGSHGQLSLNSEGKWKPTKPFEITKKDDSKLCLNSQNESNELGNGDNINLHGVIVFKEGINVEVFADIFPEGDKVFLHNIAIPELFDFLLGKDDSLKGKILAASQVDEDFLNANKILKPLLDDYPGILALKLDIMLGQFLWKFINRFPDIFFNKQNSYPNHINLWTALGSPSCSVDEVKWRRETEISEMEICPYKSDETNKMREIEFGKTIKAAGKIGTFASGKRYLDTINKADKRVSLFSIEWGNDGTNFATLTDEMNGNVYDYGSSILENLKSQSIQ